MHRLTNDQARMLRSLMTRHQSDEAVDPMLDDELSESTDRALVVGITSGKGGVGKSVVATNLAVAMAKLGRRVCILDAASGVGNVDLLCGLNGYWNMTHVFSGARKLQDIILSGPAGIDVIPGCCSLPQLRDAVPEGLQEELLTQFRRLEHAYDCIVLDAGSLVDSPMRKLLHTTDRVLLVTTPEPTAMADAYAVVKDWQASPEGTDRMQLLINQSETAVEAQAVQSRLRQTSQLFLQCHIEPAGWIPRDPHVMHSVMNRIPVVLSQPEAPASRAVFQLANRLTANASVRLQNPSLFSHILQSFQRSA